MFEDSQHTPDPWLIEYLDDGDCLITDEQGVSIARIYKHKLDPTTWFVHNTRLLHLAPNLLRLLTLAVNHVESSHEWEGEAKELLTRISSWQ